MDDENEVMGEESVAVEKGFTSLLSRRILEEVNKAVVNQDDLTILSLTTLFSGGHVLIEGVPGLAKTLWVRAFSKAVSVDSKRVQFTSDLMPSDIIGTKVFRLSDHTFELQKGPLFTNFFLADEINRTPPKTQSALLEAMEERSITIDGDTIKLPEPFIVFATQNPIEYEGTYPLPEALSDRFMMKLILNYPGVAAEKKVLQMVHNGFESKNLETAKIKSVCNASDILKCKEEIMDVRIDDSIMNYIISIVETTRRVRAVLVGASPRASVAMLLNSKAYAAMMGRDYVIPDDVRVLALPILRHRIILSPESEVDGVKTSNIIEDILSNIKVPR